MPPIVVVNEGLTYEQAHAQADALGERGYLTCVESMTCEPREDGWTVLLFNDPLVYLVRRAWPTARAFTN